MFGKLFGARKDEAPIADFLSPGTDSAAILILSASCCNPMSYGADDRLKESVGAAVSSLGMKATISTLSITQAQKHVSALTSSHPALVQDIQSIFQTHGLKAFPAVVVNGSLAFYGGVPEIEALKENLRRHLTS